MSKSKARSLDYRDLDILYLSLESSYNKIKQSDDESVAKAFAWDLAAANHFLKKYSKVREKADDETFQQIYDELKELYVTANNDQCLNDQVDEVREYLEDFLD